MKNYKIVYTVRGAETIFPLIAYVPGDSEEDAKLRFMCSGKFYNTNDLSKVVIESIRRIA